MRKRRKDDGQLRVRFILACSASPLVSSMPPWLPPCNSPHPHPHPPRRRNPDLSPAPTSPVLFRDAPGPFAPGNPELQGIQKPGSGRGPARANARVRSPAGAAQKHSQKMRGDDAIVSSCCHHGSGRSRFSVGIWDLPVRSPATEDADLYRAHACARIAVRPLNRPLGRLCNCRPPPRLAAAVPDTPTLPSVGASTPQPVTRLAPDGEHTQITYPCASCSPCAAPTRGPPDRSRLQTRAAGLNIYRK